MPTLDPRFFESHQEIIPLDAIRDRHFTVVGCGALGTITGRILARIGAHRFHLIDSDRVEMRHLNREVYGQDQIGTNKAAALAYQLTDIHPKVRAITTAREFETDQLVRGEEDLLLLTTNHPKIPQKVLDVVNTWDRAERPAIFVARHTGLRGGYWMTDPKVDDVTQVPPLPWLAATGEETEHVRRRIATTAHVVSGLVGQAMVAHILGQRVKERVDIDLEEMLRRSAPAQQTE